MAKLREMIAGPEPVLAPLVLNPLMAKLAENAGFRALYLGGGATGYMKVCLEANLTLTEMCQTAIEVGAVTPLPLIFDAAAGFGDPMHMRRTIAMSEAAGFQAIEIEDQWLPKRAHHHIGLEHMVEKEIMATMSRSSRAPMPSGPRTWTMPSPGPKPTGPPAQTCCCCRRAMRRRRASSPSGSAGRSCISRAPAAWPISA